MIGLRILCLEDNPLIAFHLEQMLADLGHVHVATFDSFAELTAQTGGIEADVALVDIDLSDGSTGPAAAAWLAGHGIPSIFVTGQAAAAAAHEQLARGVIVKPFNLDELRARLDLLAEELPHAEAARGGAGLPGGG